MKSASINQMSSFARATQEANLLEFARLISEDLAIDFSNVFSARTPLNAVADDYRDNLNDTTAPFGILAPGTSSTGVIETSGDRDVFSIQLTSGQAYTFNLNRGASAGLADPILGLYSGTGAFIATNDDFGGGRNSQISYTASSSGTFYLTAQGYRSGTGSYTLSSTGTPPAPTDDFRDSVSDTTAAFGAVTVGAAAAAGRIESGGDADLFAVSLVAGQTYSFALNAASSGGLSNPTLRLLNGSGSQLAANNDAGGTLNSQISFTASSSGTYYLEAKGATSALTGNYTVGATNTTAPPTGGGAFDIVIRYSGDSQYLAAFEQAAARWEEIITGDLPNFNSSQFGAIDDLLIDASAIAIDGRGGVLGRAGPDQLRPSSQGGLPVHGIMEFDSADLAGMAANGTLVGVILHEMGHVLGLGTLWSSRGLANSSNQYTGAQALGEYRTLSGNPNAQFIPLENDGGPGTAGGHWEEDIFGTEIMTGFANGSLPISRMTIASLRDLGYQVNLAEADPYVLPGNSASRFESLAAPEPVFGII